MADIETTLRAMEERCEAATPPPWGFTVDSKTHKPAWLYSGHEGEESDLAEFEEWDGHYAYPPPHRGGAGAVEWH
jgi:hypothetical protein